MQGHMCNDELDKAHAEANVRSRPNCKPPNVAIFSGISLDVDVYSEASEMHCTTFKTDEG